MKNKMNGTFGFMNKPNVKIASNLFMPKNLHERVWFSNNLSVLGNNKGSINGGGISFNKQEANISAFGEYVERYASSFQIKRDLQFGSYEVLNRSQKCYSPEKVTYFLEEQYQSKDFNLKRLTNKTETYWIESKNFLSTEKILIPFFMANVENIKDDGLFHINTTTGTACHETRIKAIECGILECIERDAFATFWYFQKTKKYPKYSAEFILTLFKEDSIIQELFSNNKISLVTFDISEYAYCSTFVVFIFFKKKNKIFQSIGSATRLNKREALIKATIEAYQGIEYTELVCEQQNNKLSKSKILRHDFSEVNSFKRHYALYNLFPELSDHVPIIKDAKKKSDFSQYWIDFYPHHIVDFSVDELYKKGLKEIYYTILSTTDVKQLGFEVVKVIMPELHLLTGHFKYPYLGLFDPTQDLFTEFPHPFP